MDNFKKYLALANIANMYMNDTSVLRSKDSPIFIPRKHTKQSYADHKRAKQKRKNKAK